jgi:uncharacterized membrane protein
MSTRFAQLLTHPDLAHLGATERRVLVRFLQRAHVVRDTNAEFADTRTLGQRVADRVAAFGGSWAFIFLFGAVLVGWIALNSLVLARRHEAFDPYPYILLNLFLSMLAAIQAPVIMMSQNRQTARDRFDAANDYEVNLKSELEIRALHEKLDALREAQWAELVAMQRDQIALLTRLCERAGVLGDGPDAPDAPV